MKSRIMQLLTLQLSPASCSSPHLRPQQLAQQINKNNAHKFPQMLRKVYKTLKHIRSVLGLTKAGLMTTASGEKFIHDLYIGLMLDNTQGLLYWLLWRDHVIACTGVTWGGAKSAVGIRDFNLRKSQVTKTGKIGLNRLFTYVQPFPLFSAFFYLRSSTQ
jgi:hypothetical protein